MSSQSSAMLVPAGQSFILQVPSVDGLKAGPTLLVPLGLMWWRLWRTLSSCYTVCLPSGAMNSTDSWFWAQSVSVFGHSSLLPGRAEFMPASHVPLWCSQSNNVSASVVWDEAVNVLQILNHNPRILLCDWLIHQRSRNHQFVHTFDQQGAFLWILRSCDWWRPLTLDSFMLPNTWPSVSVTFDLCCSGPEEHDEDDDDESLTVVGNNKQGSYLYTCILFTLCVCVHQSSISGTHTLYWAWWTHTQVRCVYLMQTGVSRWSPAPVGSFCWGLLSFCEQVFSFQSPLDSLLLWPVTFFYSLTPKYKLAK